MVILLLCEPLECFKVDLVTLMPLLNRLCASAAAEGSIATDVTFDKKERRALKLASMRRRARSRRLKKQCDSDSAVADDGTLGKTLAGFENVRQGICNVSY